MTTPEENENQKLEQFLKNQPSFIARLLGRLKKGKVEKPSFKKRVSNQINIQKARDALKIKRELAQSSNSNPPCEPEKP